MNLDELAPRPNSKKLAEVTSKTFGYSVDLKTLDLPKAQQIKETFTNKLKKLDETLGAKVVSDKRYYEAKLVVETVDQFIREYNDGMSDEAHELVLFGENDYDLYRQRTVPIQKNLTKKWDKGVYDHDLAVKLWKYWADDAAMRYAKMHGSPNIKWSNMFSVADRMQAAEYMADMWEEELEAGNKMDEQEVDEGKMSDIDLHVEEMIADGATDEEIMAMHPGIVTQEYLDQKRADSDEKYYDDMEETVVEGTDDLDWIKRMSGIGSSARSNHGLREGEPGYQIKPRSMVAREMQKLKDIENN